MEVASMETPRLENVVSSALGIDEQDVTDALGLYTVRQWDSRAHIELMVALGKAFDRDIDPDLLAELTTVGAIRSFIAGVAPGVPSAPAQPAVSRGLAGVVVAETSVSDVDGAGGRLSYRGIDIDHLVASETFESVAYLLLTGRRAAEPGFAHFVEGLVGSREIPRAVLDLLFALRQASTAEALRTAISALPALDPQWAHADPQVRVLGMMPSLIAAHDSMYRGGEPPAPSTSPSTASALLDMLRLRRDPARIAALDTALMVQAEHSSNASAFAARVVAGTGAGLIEGLVAAMCTFAGPRHGGAVADVVAMTAAITNADEARAHIRGLRDQHRPVPGFGHRVYRVADPRSRHLRATAASLAQDAPEAWAKLEVLEAIRAEMADMEERGLAINVDFYAAVVYDLLGFAANLCVPVFELARTPGWIAHYQEHLATGVLIRPLLAYVPSPRESAAGPAVNRSGGH
jgi:citrate synthase